MIAQLHSLDHVDIRDERATLSRRMLVRAAAISQSPWAPLRRDGLTTPVFDLMNVPEVNVCFPRPRPGPVRMKGERVGIHIPADLFRPRNVIILASSLISLSLFSRYRSQKYSNKDSITILVLRSLTYETRVGPTCRSKLPLFTASSSFERKRTAIVISPSSARTGSRLTSTIIHPSHQPKVTRYSNQIRRPTSWGRDRLYGQLLYTEKTSFSARSKQHQHVEHLCHARSTGSVASV
jgi:hypothetical protein